MWEVGGVAREENPPCFLILVSSSFPSSFSSTLFDTVNLRDGFGSRPLLANFGLRPFFDHTHYQLIHSLSA